VENTSTGERYAFPYRPLNVERDVFPVPSGQFDVVVCCEILEHLLINPSHMFYEAHRALVPGGTLLVSTPNVARWENVLRLAAGLNIYDRYHGNGVYGRHNREYTLDEVRELLQACGFAVERGVTRDVYPSAFAPGHAPDGPDRGDTLFVRARASAPARQGCPGSLYVLLDQYRNVLRDTITMGVNEVGHLGAGWHEAEWDGDQGCRWTLGSATCFLRHDGVARTISARVCAHHPDLASHPVTVDVTAGGIEAGRFEIATAGWQDATVSLPAGATPGPLEIRFAVDRTWSPSRAGGDDTRELGLRVARIGLS
jgi:hypothetical protein